MRSFYFQLGLVCLAMMDEYSPPSSLLHVAMVSLMIRAPHDSGYFQLVPTLAVDGEVIHTFFCDLLRFQASPLRAIQDWGFSYYACL